LDWEEIDYILCLSTNENVPVCAAVNWMGLMTMSIIVEKILDNEESDEIVVWKRIKA
jgi:hypothetical protein